MPDQPIYSKARSISVKNQLLNALPDADRERLRPDLEPVQFSLGEIVYRPEEPIEYVYFPNEAMISVIANTFNGQTAEVGVIGSEGVVGVDVFMGSDRTLNENIIQISGGALRIKTAAIKNEFDRGGALHDRILIFIRLMMIQISQTAVCNRLHSAEERLARWLLMCLDRAESSNELKLTQEFLGVMLGANRATVTMSAITLQNTGFINYKRGQITVTDRVGMENYACGCYQIVRREYARLPNQN